MPFEVGQGVSVRKIRQLRVGKPREGRWPQCVGIGAQRCPLDVQDRIPPSDVILIATGLLRETKCYPKNPQPVSC